MAEFNNIGYLNLEDYTLEQLDSMFFHMRSNNKIKQYETDGIPATVGKNSIGIDDKASIFFVKGIEGILEICDVWFKWKLDKLFNPYNNENATEEQINNWQSNYNNQIFNDDEVAYTFETMYNEWSNSTYYRLDLKENEEFTYDQIDHKKASAIRNAETNGYIQPRTKVMYGDYSDFSTPVVDKWNMQTIPGENITIEPSRLKVLCAEGQNDVVSIILYLYQRYRNESINQVNLPMLDRFVEYAHDKRIQL